MKMIEIASPLPRLRPGVTVEVLSDGFQVIGESRGVHIAASASICEDLLGACGLDGTWSNDDRESAARANASAIRALFREGLALDERSPSTDAGCSGWNFLGTLVEHVDQTLAARFADHCVLNGLVQGTHHPDVARGWVLENFHFTAAAEYHIAPLTVRGGVVNRALWARFLQEERWHWHLYGPLFSEFGWSIQRKRESPPLAATSDFIALLRSFSEESELNYAAALMVTEQPPISDQLELDPLFGSMCKNYRFSQGGIEPLFRHVCENGTNGHFDIPTLVFSGTPWLDRNVAADVLNSVTRLGAVLESWYREIGACYGSKRTASARLIADE